MVDFGVSKTGGNFGTGGEVICRCQEVLQVDGVVQVGAPGTDMEGYWSYGITFTNILECVSEEFYGGTPITGGGIKFGKNNIGVMFISGYLVERKGGCTNIPEWLLPKIKEKFPLNDPCGVCTAPIVSSYTKSGTSIKSELNYPPSWLRGIILSGGAENQQTLQAEIMKIYKEASGQNFPSEATCNDPKCPD